MGIDRSALVGEYRGGGVETEEYLQSSPAMATATATAGVAGGGVASGVGVRSEKGDIGGFDGTHLNLER